MARSEFSPERSTTRYWLAGLALVVMAGGAAAWFLLAGSDDAPSRPTAETRAWASALVDGRYGDLDVLAPGSEASVEVEAFFTTVGVTDADVIVVPPLLVTEDTAVSTLGITLDVGEMGPWSYRVDLPWTRSEDGTWTVDYSSTVVHPALTAERTIRKVRSTGDRAALLDRDGQPLRMVSDVVEVAIQPSRMSDQAQVEAALESQLGIPVDETRAALEQPWVTPESRVPIAVLDAEEYREIHREVLHPVPGLVFADGTEPHLPSATFAAQTIGTVGEITAEQLDEMDDRYEAGDIVGRSGLEEQYEPVLAGGVDWAIELVDGDTVVDTLLVAEGPDPESVTTTFDPRVQLAADAALASVEKPAAIVAIEPETGEVLAVSSTPTSGFNRALAGQYPPGSTFKVVTATSLLGDGVTTDQIVPCPSELDVNGNTISNFQGQSLGEVPFSEIFVRSCNTGFMTLALEHGAESLTETATALGFGADYDIGAPSVGGVFPPPTGSTELAAASIGQAQVLASPLHMASVAAAAASGSWIAPRLIRDPDVEAVRPPDVVPSEVPELMLEVVERGTGTAAAVDGLTIGGKTGTAEFGSGETLDTHAWFIGFTASETTARGLAFAVVIEEGGTGGGDAAPIAGRFLENLSEVDS